MTFFYNPNASDCTAVQINAMKQINQIIVDDLLHENYDNLH